MKGNKAAKENTSYLQSEINPPTPICFGLGFYQYVTLLCRKANLLLKTYCTANGGAKSNKTAHLQQSSYSPLLLLTNVLNISFDMIYDQVAEYILNHFSKNCYFISFISKIRHKDFRPLSFVCLFVPLRVPPWILKLGELESSGQIASSYYLKTKGK